MRFIKILSVIGITILYILGILLALILIILFVPVSYKVKGSYKDKIPDFKACVSYMGFVFRLTFLFKGSKPDLSIRIFGIRLKKRNAEKKASLEEEASEEEESKEDKEKEEGKEEDETPDKPKSPFQKINDLKDKVNFYLELIKKNSTKRAFSVLKKNLLKMLKSILPKKGRINIWLGMENAGTTGEILGAYKALYDYIGGVIHFYPYFDREYLECNLKVKGLIFPFILVYRALKIYFNRDCNRLIKILRKKTKADAGKENQ